MDKQPRLTEGQVISKDGTAIAFDRQGNGPIVILVGGGLTDRSENAPLGSELAKHFTVYNYDRRGRGKSTDTAPYALERELEDIEALITEAGGSAYLYGVSSGGALVLETAAAGVQGIDKIAIYEVPYNMAQNWPERWDKYAKELKAALADDRRGDALALFMKLTGSSDEEIAGAKQSPFWPGGEAKAHTLVYDAAVLGNGQPSAERLAKITQPTLVATGTDSHLAGAADWVLALDPAADAIAAIIPHAERQVFEGQPHVANPEVVAPILERFFNGSV
ncbi:alpha/beta hydrolase fold [candidate division TM7 genomosp. GTL1]|nr:alpha/beta hydrolase fold [candidate division TM7 genomosp. GTL1]